MWAINAKKKSIMTMNNNIQLNLSRIFHAPTAAVWDALTNPEKIKMYLFGTETLCDWRVGSPIVFRGVWEGKAYEDKGTILEIEKEKMLKYNYWSNFSGEKDIPENYVNITYRLSADGDKTVFSITQDKFKTNEARDHSIKNWNMVMDTLQGMLEKP
jgi:uncharacterized protein YndB with AHSA1/START domain